MATHDTITAAIRNAGTQPALVAYITAGFPDKATFRSQLLAVAEAADVVEVRGAVHRSDGRWHDYSAFESPCSGPRCVAALDLERTDQPNPRPQAPVLLMSYLNPLLAFGLDKLPQALGSRRRYRVHHSRSALRNAKTCVLRSPPKASRWCSS